MLTGHEERIPVVILYFKGHGDLLSRLRNKGDHWDYMGYRAY